MYLRLDSNLGWTYFQHMLVIIDIFPFVNSSITFYMQMPQPYLFSAKKSTLSEILKLKINLPTSICVYVCYDIQENKYQQILFYFTLNL